VPGLRLGLTAFKVAGEVPRNAERSQLAESPMPEHRPRRGVDRTAIRAAAALAVVGSFWVAVTDIVLLGAHHESWFDMWPRSVNRAVFVLAASAVVFLLVRRYGRQ